MVEQFLPKNNKKIDINEEEIKLIMGCAQKGDLETKVTIISFIDIIQKNLNQWEILQIIIN